MIKHIVAFAKTKDGLAIGVNNKLPWHLPEDLQHFKQETLGKTIYMGSNTFRSIVKYAKGGLVLPGREIVVISSSPSNAQALKDEFGLAKNVKYWTKSILDVEVENNKDKEFIIVGGAKLYSAYKPDVVIATSVDVPVEDADAFYNVDLDTDYIMVNGHLGHSFSSNLSYIIGTYRLIPK